MDDIHLLYVDKSRIAQRLMEQSMSVIAVFEAVGSVEEAESRMDAADAAGEAFNFFIIDHELPDGTGLDLARSIRRRPAHAHTPILLYTASLNNELAYQAMTCDINDSVAKPADLLQLRQRVVELVDLPQIRRVRRTLLQLTCFAWIADGTHYEYSPDLQEVVTGDSHDATRQKMQERLEQRILSMPDPSQYPADVHVMKHVIDLPADTDASQAAPGDSKAA